MTTRHAERSSEPLLDNGWTVLGARRSRSRTGIVLSLLVSYAIRDGASSHSGRRTLITGLAERGVDLKAIAEIAGHTSIRTTAMYVESNPKRLARILQDVTFRSVRCPLFRSLLGAKRTCRFALHMSANDPKRTLAVHCGKGF